MSLCIRGLGAIDPDTSVRNIGVNPLVCVSLIYVLVQQGFKAARMARDARRQDREFSRRAAQLEADSRRVPIHSFLVVRATAINSILALSYRLFSTERAEQSQGAWPMQAYAVQPSRVDA